LALNYRTVQANLKYGFAYTSSPKVQPYKYMNINYGILSGTSYVEVVPFANSTNCTSLVLTLTLKYVDDSLSPIATSTDSPCTFASANTYTCVCDFSLMKQSICKYDYFYTTSRSFSVAYTKTKCP
jgi:hypothetical protein